jgi:diketogulonate reductase-like aldo/keto reductase
MDIADELGVSAGNVALKWTMDQGFPSIPIVGATKVSQLEDNLKTVDIKLTADHLKRLDEVSAIQLGFPGDFFREEGVKTNTFGGFYDKVEKRSRFETDKLLNIKTAL